MAASNETTVTSDRSCAKCGYALRTLSRRGKCPECGYPIMRSLHLPETRKLLEREDHALANQESAMRWRRRVTILAIVCLISAGLALAIVVLPITLPRIDQYERASYWTALTIGSVLVGGLSIGLLLILIGAWLGVVCEHAAYVQTCRTSGDRARSSTDRKRDDRTLRRMNDYAFAATSMRVMRVIVIAVAVLPLCMIAVLHSPDAVVEFALRMNLSMLLGVCWWFALFCILFWIADARFVHAKHPVLPRGRSQETASDNSRIRKRIGAGHSFCGVSSSAVIVRDLAMLIEIMNFSRTNQRFMNTILR